MPQQPSSRPSHIRLFALVCTSCYCCGIQQYWIIVCCRSIDHNGIHSRVSALGGEEVEKKKDEQAEWKIVRS